MRFGQFLMIFFLMLPCVTGASELSEGRILDYTLRVSVDVKASSIRGIAAIPVAKGQELRLQKGRLNLTRISLDDQVMDTSVRNGTVKIVSPREGVIQIGYEGIFTGLSEGFHGGPLSNVIGDQGIFLTGTWFPKPDQMCRYHLTAVLPNGYEAISEAETINRSTQGEETVFTFDFPYPLESISLTATDRYKIVRDHFDGVEIFAYFFPEDGDLVKTYLDRTKQYLKRYDALINKYPYKRFSIVENFLPTGYSMPTHTLLGQEVVRLPFIPETSLGHEILHQWFGNSVYIDEAKGNWAEGLTTFLADHDHEEEQGRGPAYRKNALVNYQSYVNDKNDFPLRDFVEKTDRASEAVGYGKTLMVFQMLRNLVGKERFFESIRYFVTENQFKKASWSDIQTSFQRYYQGDLSWFFKEWVDEKGLPEFRLQDVAVEPAGADFRVTFAVVQRKPLVLDLPVTVYSYSGKTKKVFRLAGEEERFEMILDDLPEKVAIDEDYDIARRLSADEFPAVVARLVGEERRIVVLPPEGPGIYKEIMKFFEAKGDRLAEPDRITFDDLKANSLVVLGADNPMVRRLYGTLTPPGGFSTIIKENPWNRAKVAGIFHSPSGEEVESAFQKIFHYGKYSVIAFDHGVNTYRTTDESARGITEELYEKAVAVEIPGVKTLSAVMDRVAAKKIIYVGEVHDQFAHHVMELEVIKNLYRRGKNIAIGMEMFQRPFQKVLDDYVEGAIDEGEFLRRTEYFQRWQMDYHLYRPILLYAKSKKIPVVALNQKKEIVDRVSRKGLDALSEDERKSVPSQMDFSDDDYRERLKKIFSEHKDFGPENFDFFYQAQIVWDETMAESIDQYLKRRPHDRMVVLAGNGHLTYGSGIPKRVARRNGYDHAIILNDAELEEGIADFVLFPGVIPGTTSPRLKVFLKDEAGKVRITGFPPDSPSEKAGMKAGDILISIGDIPVRSVDDVKIELLSRRAGDRVKVKILRKGFLGFSREMGFEVLLR